MVKLSKKCPQFQDYKYISWVRGSDSLDYFDFANYCQLGKQETNAHYASILETLINLPSRQVVKVADLAEAKYKSRKDRTSEFYDQYKAYWQHRQETNAADDNEDDDNDDDSALSSVRRRQAEALITVNESICSIVESESKRRKTISSAAANSIAELPCGDKVIVEGVFDIDDPQTNKILRKDLTEKAFKVLKKKLAMQDCERSSEFTKYINGIKNASRTQHALQISCLTPVMEPQEYDPEKHEDYRVAQKLMQHFLDIIQAPKNILLEKSRERTAAYSTVIFIVNTLFLPRNDKVDFRWIEVSISATGRRKWDGIGIPVEHSRAVSAVAEFAGGIKTHGRGKRDADSIKLVQNAVDVVNNNSMHVKPGRIAKAFCILFYNLKITFDILVLLENKKYAKKTLAEVQLPKNEVELWNFAGEVQKLLQWRDTVMASAEDFR